MHPIERMRTLRLVKNIKKKMSDSNVEHRNQT